MKILFVSSESVPFVKTGGLGDVVGTLTKELPRFDHETALVMPLYSQIDREKYKLKVALDSMGVQMGNCTEWCRVWETDMLAPAKIYFIEHESYFGRDRLYDDGKNAYYDNGIRFGFLSKASLQVAIDLNFQPDIVHCSDWQTAITPFFIKCWQWPDNYFKDTASILTIHNLGYQGYSDASFSNYLGLGWNQMRPDEFEAMGAINLLKGGIFYADHITTVSRKYAREIMSEPGGEGVSLYLNRRRDDITGILNGIDLDEWDTETDKLIPANYSTEDMSGKAVCKAEVQKYFNLEVNPDKPLFGLVGRMADQKGLDLLRDCVHDLMRWDLQMVILGSGDYGLESFFGYLPGHYSGKFGSYIGFDNRLAHMIEAGSDFFVMPSRYEPCGLNQMYSLRYGTPPIVRATGGLYDTVESYNEHTNTGTGFLFSDPTPGALRDTIGWALHNWYKNRDNIEKMRIRGMKKDLSWDRRIKDYEKTYKRALWRRSLW